MYVTGLASTTRGPGAPPGRTPSRASATAARAPPARGPAKLAPTRSASSSSTRWPTLWRWDAYAGPGLPRPATSQRSEPMRRVEDSVLVALSVFALDGEHGLGRALVLVLRGLRRRDRDDERLGVADERGALGQLHVGSEDVRAGLEALDRDLDELGQVRRLGLERELLEVGDVDRAGSGLADHVHGDVDGDLLALAHDLEVDVLDGVADRVALDVLRDRELHRAVELDLEEHVGDLEREERRVAGQRDVDGVGAVAVEHGGDEAGTAGATCRTLAELGAGGRGKLGHDGSWVMTDGLRRLGLDAGRGTDTRECVRHVDHGALGRPASLAEAIAKSLPAPQPAQCHRTVSSAVTTSSPASIVRFEANAAARSRPGCVPLEPPSTTSATAPSSRPASRASCSALS